MSWDAEGVATALVMANQDPEGLCRVKVRYPWHDAPNEVHWARLCTPMAGKERGMVFRPEIGDEVLVAFERGDVRRPYVIGSLWNTHARPPQIPPNGERRLIKSRKGHMLALDDGSSGLVELTSADGRKVIFDEQGVTLRDAKGNRFRIDSTGGIEIVTDGKLTIRAAAVSIESGGAIDVKSAATLGLRGALININ